MCWAQSWEGNEYPLNAHSAMLVVALTQRGGQEKGKGHRSEGKTGDPGGGEGAPSAEFQLGGLATPTTSWSLDCSMGHAWGTGWRSGEEALAKQGCEAAILRFIFPYFQP